MKKPYITRVRASLKNYIKTTFLCYRKGLKGIRRLAPKNPFRREA